MDLINDKVLKQAVDNSFNQIIITDTKGVICYANNAIERVTGFKKKDVIGKTPLLWGGFMSKNFYKKLWDTIREKREIFNGEVLNKKKNGDHYHAKITISPIISDSGELTGFIGTEEDITFQKEYEKEKSEFFSMTAHNLRTPLGTISWNLELVLANNSRLTKKELNILKRVYDTNEDVISLVNDLLHVLSMQECKYKVYNEDIKIEHVINNILGKFNDKIAEKKLVINKRDLQKSLKLNTDLACLNTILTHIIKNAIIYSCDNSEIKIYTGKNSKGEPIISIKDFGMGISEEDKQKIFTQFFHSKRTMNNYFGLGLGLFIVKTYIEYLGGHIWVDSTENQGAEFHCQFPLMQS